MYRVSMELFTLSACKVKVAVNVRTDFPMKGQYNIQTVVGMYSGSGSKYITLTPRPFLIIDFNNKKEAYTSSLSVRINERDLFWLINALQKFIMYYIKDEELYVYDQNGLLIVDSAKAKKYGTDVKCGNKVLHFEPSVVEELSEESGNYRRVEGAIIYINNINYSARLSYQEMRFFLYELKKIDLNKYGLDLVQFYISCISNKASNQNINNSIITTNDTKDLPSRYETEKSNSPAKGENLPEIHREGTIPKI